MVVYLFVSVYPHFIDTFIGILIFITSSILINQSPLNCNFHRYIIDIPHFQTHLKRAFENMHHCVSEPEIDKWIDSSTELVKTKQETDSRLVSDFFKVFIQTKNASNNDMMHFLLVEQDTHIYIYVYTRFF